METETLPPPPAPRRQPKPISAAVFRELEKLQETVYEAQAMLQCVLTTLEEHEHLPRWPEQMPRVNLALRPVVTMLEAVATGLYEDEFTAAVAEGGDER